MRFCIICNYVNRIIPAIQSRCTRFRYVLTLALTWRHESHRQFYNSFGPLPIEEVKRRLQTVIEQEKVQLTPDGLSALLKLSRGDMRRALNVLQVSAPVKDHRGGGSDPLTALYVQACHSAYDVVDEEAVYNCTGNPHPADIEDIVDSMMNEEFQTSFNREYQSLPNLFSVPANAIRPS